MRRASGLLLLLFCAGCAHQASAPIAAAPPPDPKTLMPALERRIYEMVEQERHKLDPEAAQLALDSELVGVAREKSADMAVRSYMAHTSPDGRTSANIIMDEDASFAGLLGENIAAQPYYVKYGVDVEIFARRMVDIWMASKNHRENLADPAYLRTGIGAAVNGNTVYVTELFAADLASLPAQGPRRP
ncbi:MAG TPA: CAP domain-containing protein [Rhizomicrobium sp.]|jgi:uncharacterized protein YkwD|nr:CAP domain-containing protein [Rhizomicrobium sp.]